MALQHRLISAFVAKPAPPASAGTAPKSSGNNYAKYLAKPSTSPATGQKHGLLQPPPGNGQIARAGLLQPPSQQPVLGNAWITSAPLISSAPQGPRPSWNSNPNLQTNTVKSKLGFGIPPPIPTHKRKVESSAENALKRSKPTLAVTPIVPDTQVDNSSIKVSIMEGKETAEPVTSSSPKEEEAERQEQEATAPGQSEKLECQKRLVSEQKGMEGRGREAEVQIEVSAEDHAKRSEPSPNLNFEKKTTDVEQKKKEWNKLLKAQLLDLCKEKGLDSSEGTKATLISRLTEDFVSR